MGYSKKAKAVEPDAPEKHKPVIKQDPNGGFFYLVDSKDGEVQNRNDQNQDALNRKIEAAWPSFDDLSKLGSEKI